MITDNHSQENDDGDNSHYEPSLVLALADLECERRRIFRSADQQLLVQGTLHAIARNAGRLERARGAGLDELRRGESRLKAIHGGGSAGLDSGVSSGNAAMEVEAELRTLRGSGGRGGHRSAGELSHCPSCGMVVLADLRDDHESSCRGKGFDDTRGTAPVTVPQSPRNVRVKAVGYESIALEWDPPILDGGAAIYDHEIFFSRFHINHVGKKVLRNAEAMPPVRTSRWCMRRPIKQEYILQGLDASTEYVDIRMRCRNPAGWSDWSDPAIMNSIDRSIDLVSANTLIVKTSTPVAPSVPLFFSSFNVTSSSIDFRWGAPFDSGGVTIERYELEYTLVVPKNSQTVGTGKPSERTKEVRHIIPVEGNRVCCYLSNLRGGTKVKNIAFRAINEAELESESVSCPDLMTLDATFAQLLLKEIERVKGSDDDFIDSDLLTGVVQREERWQYLRRLEEEVKKLGPEADWKQVERNSALPAKDEPTSSLGNTQMNGNDAVLADIVPDYERRKLQYLYRMRRIKEDINDCHIRRQRLAEQRNYLSCLLVRAQERIHSLNAEVDRVSTFDGGRSITSSALHESAEQRFDVRQLQRELQTELVKVQGNIATWKAQIIESDTESHNILDMLERKEDRLKERRAAYKQFEQQTESVASARQMVSRTPQDSQRYYFREWASSCRDREKMREALTILETSSIRSTYLYAIGTWRDALRGWAENSLGERVSEANEVRGRGGVLLRQAEQEQRENVAFSSSLMRQLATASEAKDVVSVGAEVVVWSSFDDSASGMFLDSADQTLLLKGDFYFHADSYEDALCCYDDLLHSMSNDGYSKVPRIQIAGLYYYLYGKVGRILVSLGQLNIAVVSLDRSLSIAEEFGSESAVGTAILALAECHAARDENDIAIFRFKAAIPILQHVGDEEGQVTAHEGLSRCYEKRGMAPHAVESENNANNIAFRRERRISSALEAMDGWRGRLINVTALEGKVITLEKATPHFVQLKRDKARALNDIEKAKLALADKNDYISKLEDLVLEIQKQMAEAQTTNKKKMISSLVHENTQEFDVDELIKRLKIKLEEVEEELDVVSAKRDRLETNIKNKYDDIKCIEEDLKVENGPLMQRVMQNQRNVRCIGLSASNTAGNDCLGRATNGSYQCILTIEKDIYLYDLRSGKLDSVFMGDGEGRHVGSVRGHTSFVTCVFFLGSYLYTGSKDMTVICWDVEQEKLKYICRGHEATITCVHADGSKVVSGSADTTIKVWDGKTGEAIKTVHGHCRGVLCLQCGPTWCVSGDSDGLIFVWDENFRCQQRLSTRRCRIMAVQFGQLEIISGDDKGVLSIWWVKSGKVLRRCKAHEGAIVDLQFDASKVVSCGLDKTVCVCDILTGDILQTLRGHTCAVLTVAFDGSCILSASRDGTLRWWEWGDQNGQRSDKVHTYSAGENLTQIARLYNVDVSTIIQWNGITDIKNLFTGEKLIVCKADPSKPTDAELKALKQQNARTMAATTRTGKFGGKLLPSGTNILPKRKSVDLCIRSIPGSLAHRVVGIDPTNKEEKPVKKLIEKNRDNLIGSEGMSLASRIIASKGVSDE